MQDFFSGETLYYGYDITDYLGVAVDIRADSVTLTLKRYKDSALTDLISEADCTTYGEAGRAIFLVAKEDTAITPNTYFYEIKYTTGSAEYIMESGIVKCLQGLGE